MILSAVLAAATLPAVADAGIWRGCSADVLVAGPGKWHTVGVIEGRGPCANKARANECRAAAASAIVSCASALWAKRGNGTVPAECKFHSGGRAMAKLTWPFQGNQTSRHADPMSIGVIRRSIWMSSRAMAPTPGFGPLHAWSLLWSSP